MSEPNVMISFRLDRDRPLRIRWLATDGVPGDGYKAQVTAIKRMAGGGTLKMDTSAILEQTAPDPMGGVASYLLTFHGMVGFPAEHADRAIVDQIADEDIEYDLEFVHADGRVAKEGRDYKILDRPRGHAKKLP
jgi:hypothetical protein